MGERKPEFFKVFLPQISSEFLKIPPAFEEHIGSVSLGIVSLNGPSGNAWNVELINNSDGFRFEKGWKEFVADHSIETGDFLVFRLDDSSFFSVTVFDKTACHKGAALVATPFLGPASNFPNVNTNSEQNKADIAEDEKANPHIGQHCESPETNKRNEHSCPTAKEPKLKKVKVENLETEILTPQTIDTSKKMSGGSSAVQYNKNSESDTIAEPIDSQRRGRVLLSMQRIPSLLSQRRVITKEEANNTVQRAKSFKSKNPCCLIVMHGSNVYTGFYLKIPGSIAKYLPKISRKMTLWDPKGKPWQVTYLINNEHAAFSGGWGAFSLANNLEESDVCIFELFRRNCMKVHIFRVVEDITPLIAKAMC